MINKNWLKVSVFLPIWGTIINIFLLFVQSLKHKDISRMKIGISMMVCAIAFFIGVLVCSLVFKIVGVSIAPQMKLVCSFVLAGFLMNFVFMMCYKKAFVTVDNK